MIIGIVSGYFNPLHLGHIDYINHARKHCNYLIAIINNDAQVILKKSIPFLNDAHRLKIVENLKSVDMCIMSKDTDETVCDTLKHINNLFGLHELKFFNSGDRDATTVNSAETRLCEELGIEFVILHLPKIYSSSQLLKNVQQIRPNI
jgi:cytidyltransferase-like protein